MKKILISIALILSMCLSVFTITGCEKPNVPTETDLLIAELQTTINSNKTELDAKINSLTEEYKLSHNELLAKISANEKALEDLKAEYDAKLKELQSENETFTKNVADLDAKYLLEVEKLNKADVENEKALANLKTEYDNKLSELQSECEKNNKAIADLDSKYLLEVNELKEKDAENEQALAKLKEEYDKDLLELKNKDAETKQDIANLDAKYLSEIEKLLKADENNLKILEDLREEHNSKVEELQNENAKTKQDIANLDAKYLEDIENLAKEDAKNLKAIEDLRSEYDQNLKELQEENEKTLKDIEDLNAKYLLDIEKLAKADANNIQALEDLKTEHEKALKELEDKDLLTDENIANLDAKYKSEVEKLVLADDNNLQALEDLKEEHDAKIKALQNKDEEILKNIEELDNKLISEVEKLVLADENNLQALEDLRAEYNSKLKLLEDKDEEIVNSIEELDNKLISEIEKLVLADENNLQALEDLRAEYNSKLKVLEDKDVEIVNSIEDLDAKYLLEVEKLEVEDAKILQAINDLKIEYDQELNKLQNKNAETEQSISNLDAKYKSEVEKLEVEDAKNLKALEDLRVEYDAKLKTLQEENEKILSAIEDLEEKYLSDEQKLKLDTENINAEIQANKTELETQINGIKTVYDEKLAEINDLIETLKNTDSTQQEVIDALIERVAELENSLQIKEIVLLENGNITIYFVDGTSQTIEKPQGHVHSFGEYIAFGEEDNPCGGEIFYRICETCNEVQFVHGDYNEHDYETTTIEPTCQAQGYDLKTCKLCGKEEKLNFQPISDHHWNSTYEFDGDYHWIKCRDCDKTKNKEEHAEPNDNHKCDICGGAIDMGTVEYAVDGSSAKVVGYNGKYKNLVIDKEYNGLPVVSIESNAFSNANITSVTIPSSVKNIANDAFYGCEKLEKIIIESGAELTVLGADAFNNCTNIKEIEVPASAITKLKGDLNVYSNISKINFLGSLDEWAEKEIFINFVPQNDVSFYLGYNLYTNGQLVNNAKLTSATAVADYAFFGCKSLTEIELPETLKTIGVSAFSYCVLLKTVKLPESLTTLGACAFENCSSLVNINVPNNIARIGNHVFNSCNSLAYNEKGGVAYLGNDTNPYFYLLKITDKTLQTITIDGCKFVANNAFLDSSLESVTIGSSVTSIGQSMFYNCESLKSVVFEKDSQLTTIGDWAFYNCSSLEKIEFPKGLVSIGDRAFSWCTSLNKVKFADGDNLTSIGANAFSYCNSLDYIEIPKSVTSMGESVFRGFCSMKILCGAESKPTGWNNSWNPYNRLVTWGYNNREFAIDFSKTDGINKVSGENGYTSFSSATNIVYGDEKGSLKLAVNSKNSAIINLSASNWGGYEQIVFRVTHDGWDGTSYVVTADSSKDIWGYSDALGNYSYQLYGKLDNWLEVKLVAKDYGKYDLYYNGFLRAEDITITNYFPIKVYNDLSVAHNFYISNVEGKINRAVLTFDANYGDVSTTVVVNKDLIINSAVVPTFSRAGYKFAGWVKKGETELFDFSNAIFSKDTTFVARWDKTFAVINFADDVNLNKVEGVNGYADYTTDTNVVYKDETSSLKLAVPSKTSAIITLDTTYWSMAKEVVFNITHDDYNNSAWFLTADTSQNIWNVSNQLGNYGYQLYGKKGTWVQVKITFNEDGTYNLYYNNYLRAENLTLERTFAVMMYNNQTAERNFYISNVVIVAKDENSLVNVIYANDDGEVISYSVVKYGAKITEIDVIPTPRLPENQGLEFEGWYADGKRFSFTNNLYNDVVLVPKYGKNTTFMKNINEYTSADLDNLYYDSRVKLTGQDYTIALDFEKGIAIDKSFKIDTSSWNAYEKIEFSFCAVNLTNNTFPHLNVIFAGGTFTPIWDHGFYNVTITKVNENVFDFHVENPTKKIIKDLGTLDFTEDKFFYLIVSSENASVKQGFRISHFTGLHKVEIDSKGATTEESYYIASNTRIKDLYVPQLYGFKFICWKVNGEEISGETKITSNISLEAYYEIDLDVSPIVIDFSKEQDVLNKVSSATDTTNYSSSTNVVYTGETGSLKIVVGSKKSEIIYLDTSMWYSCKEIVFNVTHDDYNNSAWFLTADTSQNIWNVSNQLGNYGYQLYGKKGTWVQVKITFNEDGTYNLYYNNNLRAENLTLERTFAVMMYNNQTAERNFYISNVVVPTEN